MPVVFDTGYLFPPPVHRREKPKIFSKILQKWLDIMGISDIIVLEIERGQKMYILYQKELYIVKEQLTKNRICQTWRGRQIAMCEDAKPLEDYAKSIFRDNEYYIQEQPW